MDKYKVKLNPQAFREIDDIFAYIALEKLSPENARGQTDRIWEALKKLENFPQSHQERIEGSYAGKVYRQLLIDNYIVIFRIDETSKTVYVVTVQYQGRNI
ncbi:type II toxin-antitoxin system RelE/ParE family toxin [Catenibacillus scindens]|uniref:type II toxin-antitoxin system RelE/ParE family toxin n=1 Tax=Catenibacillus scindens TaxID=673271 RepID=UPI0032085994